ncbi:hypothetical protein [Mannheimia bovis]|uniref:Uncharacterized protein n=1 Tax=Mannheimia bovis TaxID=2770636 RepID=A0A7H1C537_9PAST|nr:hypothetical protein [Mannheimia bovis]QNS16092.1 hypothetical protein ICJ55_05035 [Mannheimia bovis]
MDKQYRFDIYYTDTRYNQNGQGGVVARNISDAKNKFKAGRPYIKITSCIRRDEVISKANNMTKSGSSKKANLQESSSIGSMLLGAAVTAGVGFVANKWFNKKDNT